jgi:hypothetical protein
VQIHRRSGAVDRRHDHEERAGAVRARKPAGLGRRVRVEASKGEHPRGRRFDEQTGLAFERAREPCGVAYRLHGALFVLFVRLVVASRAM